MRKIRIANKKRFIIVTVVSILLLISIIAGINIYNKIKNPQKAFEDDNSMDQEEEDTIDINEQFDKSKINILIYGLDKNEYRDKEKHYEVYRSDTIMVATIDFEANKVDLVSIPRDTYVSIYNRNGKDKINSAFYYGELDADSKEEKLKNGVNYLINTASQVLGSIPINYYIGITDMDVVNDIVDELGGIEIKVLHTLYADKGHDKNKVQIEEGLQTLNGKQLQYYARYRAYPLGDIDRVANQQHIIKALIDNMKKTNSIIKLPKIYSMVSEKLDTNLTLDQITALSLFGVNFDRENLNTHTLPGDFGELGGISYWIINQQKRSEFLKEVYDIDVGPDKQDAKSDKLTQLTAKVEDSSLAVGEKTKVNISGKTANGKTLNYDVNDTAYSLSADGIIQLNADNSIVAKSSGNVTLSFKVEGITAKTSVTVNAPVQQQPVESKPPVDTIAPTLYGVDNIKINLGDLNFTLEKGVGASDDIDPNPKWGVIDSGGFNINVAGTYYVKYQAWDTSKNYSQVITREVIVNGNSNEQS